MDDAAREAVLGHVGSRIRLYRRSRGMNLADLGECIQKSKASLSKYESGQVAVDIITLFDIARALEVSPAQLFDYDPPQRHQERPATLNPFLCQEQLYLYHMHRKKVYFSLLRLGAADENGRMEVTLFYKADSPSQIERCDCIYHGVLQGRDTVISVLLSNYHNAVENILLNFSIPMRRTDTLTGMLSGLDVSTHVPTAYRILLSKEPIPEGADLAAQLIISTEAYREMRAANNMVVR